MITNIVFANHVIPRCIDCKPVSFYELINKTSPQIFNKCQYLLLPYFYKNGSWIDQDGNGFFEELKWLESEPNGGGLQKCTITNPKSHDYKVADAFCESLVTACPICKWTQNPTLLLKGLQRCSNLDIEYRFVLEVGQMHNDMLLFKGFDNRHYILYENGMKKWVLTKGKDTSIMENIIGYQVDRHETPIGLHDWKMTKDDCTDTFPLKMTSVNLTFQILQSF